MEVLTNVLEVFFILFLIYTLIFVLQWIFSFCISVYRMSQYHIRREIVQQVYTDEIAEKEPVTIIIPAYNEEACICQTIDSLMEEDYPNLEIIVVSDGATDHTEQVVIDQYQMLEKGLDYKEMIPTQDILKYYEKDMGEKKLRLVGKKNGGKSDALNCGLNLCHSPYCVILDADTKVEKGSIRNMRCQFMADEKMIVCAGVVGNTMHKSEFYKTLSCWQKILVLFQQLEYYRTFYMQRVFFDKMNANVVVSGAFAMFDVELLREVGGYKRYTIGEDMEVTMRLHAFCQSQKKRYHIGYIPEVRCNTQLPFRYKDYYNQRRRWHIGMIQSLKEHKYMLGSLHYGGAGIISGTFILLYELWAPFIEVIGVITVFLSMVAGILNVGFVIKITVLYILLAALTQSIVIYALNIYEVETLSFMHKALLFLISILEVFFFHPFNILIKLNAFFTAGRYKKSWKHIERENEK